MRLNSITEENQRWCLRWPLSFTN